jgi:hypothetical protein
MLKLISSIFAVGMLATACVPGEGNYGNINPNTQCEDQTCSGDPLVASAGYRICKPTSAAPANSPCYYQNNDGVITQCNSCSDCSNAVTATKTWCSEVQ